MAITATAAAGSMAWSLVKALAAAGAAAEAVKCLEEYFDDINKLGYSKEYLNELIKNPESIADLAWEEYEEETLYPSDEDEPSSKYKENYENTKEAEDKLTATEDLFTFDETTTGGEKPPTNEDDKKTPIVPGISGGFGGSEESGSSEESGAIKDGTDENTGTTTISPMDWITKIEEWRENDRAREDQIRAETQAREDTAWQRGVEDMRKSGINVNLVGAQPAASGGGITSATGVNTSALTSSMNNEIKEMLQVLEQGFKGNENDKDRFMQSFSQLMSFMSIIIALTGRK